MMDATTMKMIGGGFATALGAAVAYASLGFPTPATSSDIERIEQRLDAFQGFAVDTRILILGQEKRSATEELRSIQRQLDEKPDDLTLIRYHNQITRSIERIEAQIKQLERSKGD